MVQLGACSGNEINDPLRQNELFVSQLFDLRVMFFDSLMNRRVLQIRRSTGSGTTGMTNVSRSLFGGLLLEFLEEQ